MAHGGLSSGSASTATDANGKPQKKHVVIIGAGVGGTCLAARLAKKGHAVTVVEKNDGPGGRCSLIEQGGHRWDVGPSLYLMPEIFEDAFKSLGTDVASHVELRQCDPTYRIHFHDGQSLDLSSSLTQMKGMLDKFEKPAGNRDPLGSFLKFVTEAGEHYEESIKFVLNKDWSALVPALATWELYPMLWRTGILRVWTTLYSRANKYFKSDHIKRAMTFSSMYMGMSPFDAPATYSLLQYAEYARGVWYPVGGFQRVPASFEKIAKELGAKFEYGTGVKRILLEHENDEGHAGALPTVAEGVLLEDGREIRADVVVSNADLVWTYNNLLPPTSYSKKLRRKDQTCSSISFYWGLKEQVKEFNVHNIFLAEAYKPSFDEIFRDGLLPTEPSFYVNVPSRVDPSAAPAGKDTIVILVPCGPFPLPEDEGKPSAKGRPTSREAFEATLQRARKQIIDTIVKRTGRKDFADLIEHEVVKTPWDWEKDCNLWRGSILGLTHSIPQVLWFRPSIQHATLRNMFFCGASTQPGTGVPVVVAGSGVVAERIDNFLLTDGEPSDMYQFLIVVTSTAVAGLACYLFATLIG